MRRIVVLRPEPGASGTVARAAELGLKAVRVPLFEIEPVEWAAPSPGPFNGLLLTSANAVRQAGGRLGEFRGLPVYAVGAATADAARNAGFAIAATGDAGVDRLLGALDPGLHLLHLCGEDRKAPATDAPRITSLPVYRAAVRPDPDLEAARGAIVLVHSPRAGQRLAELVTARATTAIAAISETAAAAAGTGWERVAIADEPSDAALLALAARLCDKTAA